MTRLPRSVTFALRIGDTEWAEVRDVARTRLDAWTAAGGPRQAGAGYYPNTIERHTAGAVGEWALGRWLDSIGLPWQAQYGGWDAVTRAACLEVKCRSDTAAERFRGQVAAGTVLAMRHRPGPAARAVVWARYTGHPATRITAVALTSWTTQADLDAGEPVTEDGQTNVRAARVYPLDTLGPALALLDTARKAGR